MSLIYKLNFVIVDEDVTEVPKIVTYITYWSKRHLLEWRVIL